MVVISKRKTGWQVSARWKTQVFIAQHKKEAVLIGMKHVMSEAFKPHRASNAKFL